MEQEGKGATKVERRSNLELLRIVSMILIVAHHYSVHGGFILPNMDFNKAFIQILSLGGKLGVDCFVLITGYFMIESKFHLEKAVKLWAQIWFYSVLFMGIFYGFEICEFQMELLIKSIFPITYSMYWFATTYLVLYVLTLFLNPALKKMSRKQHLALTWTLGIFWSILPTFTNGDFGYSSLGLFLLLYLIGAYFRLYPSQLSNQCGKSFVLGIIMYGVIIAFVFLIDYLSVIFPGLEGYETYLSGENKVTTILCAIGLFLGFKNLRMKYHPWLNRFASSVFGVYLIQENYFVHSVIWRVWFQNRMYSWSSWLWLHAIICVAMVLTGGVIIDQIRVKLIEEPLFYQLRKKNIWESLERKLLVWQEED